MTDARHIDDLNDSELATLVGKDIPGLLASRVEAHPERTFLVWEPFVGERQTWTYGEFGTEVERAAVALARLGVAPGDRVLLHMDNRPEFLLVWFACARLGAIVVSTNTRSVERDMAYYHDKAKFAGAITEPRFVEMITSAASELGFVVATSDDTEATASTASIASTGNPAGPNGTDADGACSDPAGSLGRSVPLVALALDELMAEVGDAALADELPDRPTDPRANLGIQFTSGTTSRPKAVLWTHANAVWGARTNVANYQLRSDDIGLVFLPMFHTNAQSYSMLSTLYVGGTLVMQPRFSASRFWPVATRNRCTWVSLIPFALKAIYDQPVPDHDLRFMSLGNDLSRFDDHFGTRTIGLWGMTETITHGTFSDLGAPGPDRNIGRAHAAYDLKVTRDDGTWVDPGETGHFFIRGIRGVQLFKEYYNDPNVTANSFDDDGWFGTGDLVAFDEAGYFYFKDRDKDMLKVGAENVAASEVEAVIMATGVASECAVVAQKHYMLDEVPVVFAIAASADLDTTEIKSRIMAACEQNLPDFKRVRSVHIVDELPRSTLEKIAKAELRARLPKITE